MPTALGSIPGTAKRRKEDRLLEREDRTQRSMVQAGLFHRADATFPDDFQILLRGIGLIDLTMGKARHPPPVSTQNPMCGASGYVQLPLVLRFQWVRSMALGARMSLGDFHI